MSNQPRRVRPSLRGAGFTIIELMVALIVLGVVVVLAVAPSMRGAVERHRVEGVNTELLTDLRHAQSAAAMRSGASTKNVAVTFGGNADLSCYTVHADDGAVVCDCTRAPGNACLPAAPGQEIKSLQLARADGVSVSASSPSGNRIVFAPPKGLATPGDLVIDVQGALSGRLRTSVSALGVPTVCSPDGSIRGVNPC